MCDTGLNDVELSNGILIFIMGLKKFDNFCDLAS